MVIEPTCHPHYSEEMNSTVTLKNTNRRSKTSTNPVKSQMQRNCQHSGTRELADLGNGSGTLAGRMAGEAVHPVPNHSAVGELEKKNPSQNKEMGRLRKE